nr:hypothetical protein [Tanacetum cinerariifolium]
MLPIELTNADIRNSEAYKEYYAISTGATPQKTKASVWKTKSSSDTTVIPPLTAAASSRLSTSAKGKQPAKASKAKSLTAFSEVAMTEAEQLKLATKRSMQQTHISQATCLGADEGTGTIPGVPDVPTDESDKEISWKSSDEGDDDDDKEGSDDQDDDDAQDDDDQDSDKEGEEFIHPRLSIHDKKETRDEESFSPIPKTPKNTDDEGNDEENLGLNVGREEGQDEEDDEDELYRDVNINLEGKGLAGAVSSIPEIIQRYMDQRMNEAVKVAVQIQLDRLRDEAQVDNEEFLKNLDKNIQKIITEQVKIILNTYGDTITLKRRRGDDANKDEEPSAGSDRGSKRRREGKDESATAKEPMQTTHEMEELSHPEFEIGADDQPIAEPSQYPEWFSQQKKPPTPDHDWNKTLPATHESIQPWISELAKQTDSRSSFNKLMDTSVDFLAFLMNRLKFDTLTLELLVGPIYELMKGSCKSLQYPHNLLKPLPLIPNSRGHCVIPFDHFINNDLEYLCGGASSRKYTTSITKTKASNYGHIKWIEDLVPRKMWIQEPIGYNKHVLWGISHWGRKRQQFYGFTVNRESARDVYSKRRIIAVTELKIVEWHNYKHLDWITGYPLVSVEVLRYDKRSKSKNMGIVPTEMGLIVEHTLQGISHEVSNSVRRPKSKGTKLKNRVLKNTKSSSSYVWKISRSVSIDSNKCETKDSNVCQTIASVSNSKTVNAVNEGSNIVCVSCGKDVFLLSHEKCVARYALSKNSNVKRALFITPVAAKSKNLGATFVVAKS